MMIFKCNSSKPSSELSCRSEGSPLPSTLFPPSWSLNFPRGQAARQCSSRPIPGDPQGPWASFERCQQAVLTSWPGKGAARPTSVGTAVAFAP